MNSPGLAASGRYLCVVVEMVVVVVVVAGDGTSMKSKKKIITRSSRASVIDISSHYG